MNSKTYTLSQSLIEVNKALTIQASDGQRPYLTHNGTLTFEGKDPNAVLVLDGLWFGILPAAGLTVETLNEDSDPATPKLEAVEIKGTFKRVEIRHCSFDPGGERARVKVKEATALPSVQLKITGDVEELAIRSSIMGPILEAPTNTNCSVGKLIIEDSIVASMAEETFADLWAIESKVADVSIERSTILGDVKANLLYCSDSLVKGVIDVLDTQHSCVRFSAFQKERVVNGTLRSSSTPKLTSLTSLVWPPRRSRPRELPSTTASSSPLALVTTATACWPSLRRPSSERAPRTAARWGHSTPRSQPSSCKTFVARSKSFCPWGSDPSSLSRPERIYISVQAITISTTILESQNKEETTMSSKGDISRRLFQPRKRYNGVRFQQGRVFSDSDFNEAGMLDAEETRRRTLDIMGPKGSPDDGFKITGMMSGRTPPTQRVPDQDRCG